MKKKEPQQDPYETLGVPKNAKKPAIKKAFRRKAKNLHPDTGGNADEFAALVKAHDILGDDAKRRRYDETGETDGEQSDEHQARAMMVKAMFEATRNTNDLKTVPLVTAIENGIKEEIDKAKANIKEAKEAIRNVWVVIKRLKYKGEGRDHLHAVLKSQKGEIEGSIRVQQENVRIAELALGLLENYEYKADEGGEGSGYATFTLNSWMAGR